MAVVVEPENPEDPDLFGLYEGTPLPERGDEAGALPDRIVIYRLPLEDEYGQMNLIVPPPVYERYRGLVRGEPLLLAHGRFERRDRNMNVLVDRVESLGPLARQVADLDVGDSLPRAHHFGHR